MLDLDMEYRDKLNDAFKDGDQKLDELEKKRSEEIDTVTLQAEGNAVEAEDIVENLLTLIKSVYF